jgi:hemoglobin-like flavoprotein
MYPWVGECLLETFADIAGDDWKPAYTRAWAEAYGAISGLMLEGAAS